MPFLRSRLLFPTWILAPWRWPRALSRVLLMAIFVSHVLSPPIVACLSAGAAPGMTVPYCRAIYGSIRCVHRLLPGNVRGFYLWETGMTDVLLGTQFVTDMRIRECLHEWIDS